MTRETAQLLAKLDDNNAGHGGQAMALGLQPLVRSVGSVFLVVVISFSVLTAITTEAIHFHMYSLQLLHYWRVSYGGKGCNINLYPKDQ